MDYPALNFSPEQNADPDFYTTKPGAYDKWAIRFGYDPTLSDSKKRAAHLSRSGEKELAFGNDADDMRSAGRGNDPRVMVGDMSDDAIRYSVDRIHLVRSTIDKLLARYGEHEGESWHELRNAYFILTGQHSTAARVISRFVGGVYQDRAVIGQATAASAPFVPVPYSEQKRAMAALRKHVFAPDAFESSAEVLSHLQRQRRGFDAYDSPEDPSVHERVLAIQSEVLDHLFDPNTLRRLTDSRLYGSKYSAFEMMRDLREAIFAADLTGSVNTYRQMLQIDFAQRLSDIVASGEASYVDPVARTAALAALRVVDEQMGLAADTDSATRAHRDHVRLIAERVLFPNGRR